MYLRDDDRLLVFASKGGSPANPDWYHNLVANPEVTIELGNGTFTAKATVLSGEERDRRYEEQSELFPQFADYQRNTKRRIPVMAAGGWPQGSPNRPVI